jgi:hypothetical protein
MLCPTKFQPSGYADFSKVYNMNLYINGILYTGGHTRDYYNEIKIKTKGYK